MANVQTACPSCGHRGGLPEEMVGRRVKCPKCSTSFMATRASVSREAPSQAPPVAPPAPRPPAAAPPRRSATPSAAPQPAVSVTWQPGEVILDLYEVVGDPIGEGGMGRVYKVRHRGWNKDLAVKVPLASQFQTEEQKRNFETECETWINLGLHPHIVSCYYVRRVGDVPCVFAEFVEGGSLHDWVRSGRLYDGGPDETLRRILDIAIQFAWGLHYAHEQGLVHQDVKPENVLVTPDGAAKVTDFGVARARAEAVTETTVAGGTMLAGVGGMTPAYCSPEQAQIRAMQEAGLPQDQWPKLTRRTDLWSWAASVFEMLAGGRKWQLGQLAGYAFDEFAQTGLDDARIPAMPAAVAELLKRCFQENPDDRPHDMHAVASELAEVYAAIARAPYPREEPKPVDLQADGLNNRAVSLLDLKKEDEARAAWEQAVARDPGHLPTLFNHGLWRWRRGEIADHDWVRELRAGSGSAEYDRWLGLAEARRANWQEARRHLEQAAKRSPGDGEVWAALGTALYNLGDAREALAALTRASELSPDRWRVWHNLGIVQTSLGVPAVATAARLTALRPDSPELVRGWASAAPSSGGCVRVFAGHRYGVVSVALSPDGRFALSGGDWTLRRWEVATGECVRVWEGQWAKVHSVASSPCGRFALSGSRDGPLHLWEAATGECLRTFEGHTGTVVSAAFSPCGRFALSGSDDQTLRLWEVETGDCVRVFEGHTSGVNSVAFSPCGRFALSGGFDDTLRLWAVATGSCIRILVGHGRFVYSVAFSPCGRFALSGSEDQTLRLWEVETGDCVRVFEGHTDSVNSVAFSPSGWFALSGSQDRTVRLWGVATGDCIRVFEGHGENVFCVAASPCGGSALSGSADGTLRLWDVTGVAGGDASTCRWPCEIEPAEPVSAEQATMTAAQAEEWLAEVRAACERSDGHGVLRAAAALRDLAGYERDARVLEVLVSASEHGILRRSGLRGAWQARVFEGHPGWVNSVAFSPDGRLVLSAGRFDRALRLWGVATGDCLGGLEGHGNGVTSVVFSPCGWFALSGSDDNTLRLWEWTTGDCVRVFDGHTAGVNCVALSPCGRLALSGSDDNTLRLWEVGSGDCICVFEGHGDRVESVAFSPCGRFALSGAGKEDPTIRLWQVATRECLRIFEGHAHGLDSAVFSPCGRFALSGSLDHTLRLWEVLTGECSRVFEGHTHWVESVAFSPCGRFGLSGSDDNALRLWEVATGNCIRVFEGHTRGVHSVAMSPDGGFALSGSHDGALRLWELDWEWEPTTPADWDEDARPYLSNFLCLQQPKGEDLLTPIGPPKWDDADFQRLLKTLGRAGYGWLRPEGVRRELEKMTAEWQGPPPLPGLG